VLLVVLTALPFTAPFATVDMIDVWGPTHPQAVATVSAALLCSPQPDDSADDVTMSDGRGQHSLLTSRCVRVLATSPANLQLTAPTTLVTAAGYAPPPAHDPSATLVTLRL